jgi:tetratricopeptide (TPR) repeat protein
MAAAQAKLKRPPSVEYLNGLGNTLYCSGKASEALESFDSALLLVDADVCLLGESLAQDETTHLSGKPLHAAFQSHAVDPCVIPDSFLEGECDVGPRFIHSPLHIEHTSLPTFDSSIVTAVLLYNKGVVHHSSGNFESAADSYGLALAALTKQWSLAFLGSDFVLSCLSRIRALVHNNLGHIRYIGGDDQNALYHFETAFELSKQVRHFDDMQEWALTVATLGSNLARTQWMIGDLRNDGLIHIVRDVLRLRSLWLPADHPDVVCSHLNLGLYLYGRDDKHMAKFHIQEYLNYAAQDGSSLDPIPALIYLLLIENEGKDDRLSVELVRALHELMETREEFGAVNVQVASLLNYIGTLLFHGRQLKESILFYKHELNVEKQLTEDTAGISISVTYNNIGRILQELGNHNEAIQCYQQALKTDSTGIACNPIRPHLAYQTPKSTLNLYSTIWYNLGLIYDRLGSRKKAIAAFKMSLKLRYALFGTDHQDVACLWYNIGTLQLECGHLEDAAGSLKEALRIKRMGCFHEDPKKISATLSRLAALQECRGRLKEAIGTHAEILQLQCEHKDMDSMAVTLVQMSELCYAQSDARVALNYAQQSLNVLFQSDSLTSHQFERHIKAIEMVANTMILIGSLYYEVCDVDSACETFRNAQEFLSSVSLKHGGLAPQLELLLHVVALAALPSCAPQA